MSGPIREVEQIVDEIIGGILDLRDLLDHDVGSRHVTLAGIVMLSLVAGTLVAAVLARVARRADPSRHLGVELAAAQLATLVTLLAIDLSFATPMIKPRLPFIN